MEWKNRLFTWVKLADEQTIKILQFTFNGFKTNFVIVSNRLKAESGAQNNK